MNSRNAAFAAWLAGYAAIAAGVVTLAGVPAVASDGSAAVVLLGLAGLAQLLWGTYLALAPNPRLEWIGVGVNAGAASMAALEAASAASGLGAGQAVRIMLSLAAMALAAYLLTRITGGASYASTRRALSITGIVIGSVLVLVAAWYGAATLPLRFLAPDAEVSGASPTPTAHASAHPEKTGHQGTYMVRLTGAQAGPYVVQAFTGPTEVGDLFVEASVRDAGGAVLGDLAVHVEASAVDDPSVSVGGSATAASAQVPGNYAIHLPVTSAGFWDVTLTIEGPLGHGVAEFTERVGGTANIAMWVLAGVPLAVALLFGFVYLRTAGRHRS